MILFQLKRDLRISAKVPCVLTANLTRLAAINPRAVLAVDLTSVVLVAAIPDGTGSSRKGNHERFGHSHTACRRADLYPPGSVCRAAAEEGQRSSCGLRIHRLTPGKSVLPITATPVVDELGQTCLINNHIH